MLLVNFRGNVAIVPLSVCRQRVVEDQKMSLASLLSSRSLGVLHVGYFKALCCFDIFLQNISCFSRAELFQQLQD